MSTDANPPEWPTPEPAPPDTADAPPRDWRYWMRRLLVCNPFFLGSAALLLFGVNRLSLDPNFLGDEQSNLLFNYFALQCYELLVVGTAIVLARRKIWYDSALLVVVENGLLLVPFMLISQATLIGQSLGLGLALGAFVFAGVREFAIRRGYPQFNLPPRALALGAALLLFNTVLPAIFPSVVKDDVEDWTTANLALWYAALPLLVAGANLLPRPRRYGGLNPERHWIPLFIYALWIAGTGAHIWCLGYISKQEFHIHYLAPALLVAVWTLWHRITDCVPNAGPRWELAILCLTFVAPLAAFENQKLFEGLVLLNGVAFAALWFRRTGLVRTLGRELLFASSALLVLGIPAEFGRVILPAFTRIQAMILAPAAFLVLSAMRCFRVRAGIAGACAAAVIACVLWPGAPLHAFVETTVIFLLAHSLGWKNDGAFASLLRGTAGAVWIADAAVWIHRAQWQTDVVITLIAVAMLATWLGLWWLTTQRRDWLILVSAAAVTLLAPADWLIRQGSQGLLALAASLALFAAGFAAAWTRHAWESRNGAQ